MIRVHTTRELTLLDSTSVKRVALQEAKYRLRPQTAIIRDSEGEHVATVRGRGASGLIAHPRVDQEGEVVYCQSNRRKVREWTVTHAPSGLRVSGRVHTMTDCLALVVLLLKEGLDWTLPEKECATSPYEESVHRCESKLGC